MTNKKIIFAFELSFIYKTITIKYKNEKGK